MIEELEQRMQAFQKSLEERDADSAAKLLDEDYALVLVHPVRAVMPRGQWLGLLDDYIVHSYVIEEQVVDVDGDCATVLHRANMKATVQGQDRSGVFIISDTWRLRDGSWRLWRRHSTPVTAGELRTAK